MNLYGDTEVASPKIFDADYVYPSIFLKSIYYWIDENQNIPVAPVKISEVQLLLYTCQLNWNFYFEILRETTFGRTLRKCYKKFQHFKKLVVLFQIMIYVSDMYMLYLK